MLFKLLVQQQTTSNLLTGDAAAVVGHGAGERQEADRDHHQAPAGVGTGDREAEDGSDPVGANAGGARESSPAARERSGGTSKL